MARISNLMAGCVTAACIALVTVAAVPATGAAPVASQAPAAPPAADVGQRAAPSLPCGGERPPKLGGGTYSCTFEDDFTGPNINQGKWLVNETRWSGITNAYTTCFTRSNVGQWAGAMHLVTRRALTACRTPRAAFLARSTSGNVSTRDRWNQTYGRFEFRAKFPDAVTSGVHSALWLYPQELKYGRWPNSGEIDVAEWYSAIADRIYPSLHYSGNDPQLRTGHDCVVGTVTEFHRYAVEWTPSVMRFFVDGRLCFQHTWTPVNLWRPKPFDHPFNIVMTNAAGTLWNPVTWVTPRVSTMSVDWVRAWK